MFRAVGAQYTHLMNNSHTQLRRPVGFAVFTIAMGAIGVYASFQLLTEYVKTLASPEYVPNCAISILVTCGPNMDSWQGSLFGFSNTIVGVGAFVAPIAVGVALLAGARFDAWMWWMYLTGLFGGFVFICWLAYQSIFVLGTLCPWCMVVWVAMVPLWWVTFLRAPSVGDVRVPEGLQRVFRGLSSWAWVFIIITFAVIAAVAQFQLNWFSEFGRV